MYILLGFPGMLNDKQHDFQPQHTRNKTHNRIILSLDSFILASPFRKAVLFWK